MKYKLVLVTLLFVTNFAFCGVPPGSQGIGVNPPKAMLHVKGEILIDSVRSTPVQDGMIQYKSNQFLFRQNGAWLPLGSGSAGNVGSGMTKRNDTLIAGGRLKDLLLYQNSTDTIFGIDTLGNVYLPKVQELSEDDKSYFIDSNLTATRNSLKDSLVYWVFDNDPSVLCYGDSTGTTRKIRFRDNNRLIIDTLHFGSCTGNELYTLLLWKANPYTVPNGYYVDTFGVLFSGYDTLNINGDASVESSYWFISDGHSFIDDPFDIDKPFTQLGNPYPIPGDTTSFLNRFFGKEKTFIDTMYVGVVIPLQDMHGYQQLIDKMVFIYPLKPKIYSLAITGDRIIKKNIVIKKNIESGGSSSNLIAGNGIGINSNEINLGDFTMDANINANNHNLSYNSLGMFNVQADGSQLQLDSTNGYFQLGSTNSINGNTGLLGFNDGISMYTSIGSLMGSQANQGMTGYKDSVIIESGNLNYDFNGEASKIKLDRYDIRMGNRFRGVKDFTIIHNPLGAPNAPGLIGINTDAPLSTFHINTNDAMIIPKGTTGQRPTGIDGMLRFNTSTNGYEGYYSSGWQPFGNIYNTDGSVTANRTVDFTDKNLTFNGNVGAASRFYIQATENGTYSLGMGAIKSQGTSNNNYGISSIGSSANYSGHYISGSTIASSGSGYKGLWLYGTATENNTGVELYGYNSGNNSTAISIYGQSGAGYNHTDARSVQIFGDAIVEIGSNDEYIMVSSSSIAPNPSHNTDLGRKAKPFDSTYTNQVVATGIHADSVIMPIEVIPPGYFTPADGATISLTKSYNIVEPSGTLTALTVNMPSSPKNGQIVSIIFTETITSLTFANGTFVNPITTSSSVGGTVTWGYYSGTGKWYRK